MSTKKVILLIPHAARTGGPEALYQLSDSLIRQGIDARIWLVTSQDVERLEQARESNQYLVQGANTLTTRMEVFRDYVKYKFRLCTQIELDSDTTFVLPEVYAWALPYFRRFNTVLWWLSVDNGLGALSKINLNSLRAGGVLHVAQSEYARKFLEALGLSASMLSDYTLLSQRKTTPLDERPLKVCFNAGQKNIFNLDLIEANLKKQVPNLELVRVAKMSAAEVADHFETTRLFVDLGQFPGKDRMIREALMLGSNVLIARAGAGANDLDYRIPSAFKWNMKSLDELISRTLTMVAKPGLHALYFDEIREDIAREKEIFDSEVRTIFSSMT